MKRMTLRRVAKRCVAPACGGAQLVEFAHSQVVSIAPDGCETTRAIESKVFCPDCGLVYAFTDKDRGQYPWHQLEGS